MNLTARFAVAVVLFAGGLWPGGALAVLPSAVPANNILYLSGSTSTDQQLEDLGRLIFGGLCSGTDNVATTQIRIFRGANQRVTLCPTGDGNIGIAKESVGGSGNAIQPVAAGDNSLVWLNVKAANFACGGTDNNPFSNDIGTFNEVLGIDNSINLIATTNLNAARTYSNCTPTATQTAQAGISDVEARLFGFTGTIDERAVEQIMFGVPVSLNLYRALQIAQGITATAACDTAGEQDTHVCVPSLTKGQIAGLYSGTYVDWSQITGLTMAPGVSLPAGGDTSVFICRRGNTSGTQAFTKAYALAGGCGGSDGFRAADDAACESDGCAFPTGDANDLVYANTSSVNVLDCLDARDDANLWAIGVLSTENTVNDIGGAGGDPVDANPEVHTREFRFVGINGFIPSLEVAANGGYDMVSENVCTRGPGLPVGGVLPNILRAICGDVTAGLPRGLSSLSHIRRLNESFDNQPHGDGGNAAKADFVNTFPNSGPVSQLEIENNPVNAYTRSAGQTYNNCSAYTSLGNSDIASATLRGPVLPGDAIP